MQGYVFKRLALFSIINAETLILKNSRKQYEIICFVFTLMEHTVEPQFFDIHQWKPKPYDVKRSKTNDFRRTPMEDVMRPLVFDAHLWKTL